MKLKKFAALAMVACLSAATCSVGLASSSSTNSRTSSSSGSSKNYTASSTTATTTTTTADGSTVSTSTSTANGVSLTAAAVTTASGAKAEVTTATQTTSVGTVTIRQNTVSGIEGVQTSPLLLISNGTTTVGCYVDMATGKPLATGKIEVYLSFDASGALVPHYVDANGFFLVGVHVINGVTLNLSAEGTPIA